MPRVNCIHNDLLVLTHRRGIYWLRLYDLGDGGYVAVATDVPGNPGFSVTNGVSLIRSAVVRDFGIDDRMLTLFTISPRLIWAEGPVWPATLAIAPGGPYRVWTAVSREQIEAIVGALPPLPDHDRLLKMVMELGGRLRETYRETFEAIMVTALPPPHGPYQCAHRERFERLGESDSREAALRIGHLFLDSLTPRDRARCRYHRADWANIADASARIVDAFRGVAETDYLAAAAQVALPPKDSRWLVSLFADPIVLADDGGSYVNGQHRGCALRFSGAERGAVVVGGVSTTEDNSDWQYLGEG